MTRTITITSIFFATFLATSSLFAQSLSAYGGSSNQGLGAYGEADATLNSASHSGLQKKIARSSPGHSPRTASVIDT